MDPVGSRREGADEAVVDQGERAVAAPDLGEQRVDGPADRRDVGVRVAAEGAGDARAKRLEEVRPVAVEVAAAGQREAAREPPVDDLVEPDRVGVGHENDVPGDLAAPAGVVEQPREMMGDQQGGRLVGMERRLQVGLGPGLGRAIAVDQQGPLRAGAVGPQGNALARPCHAPNPLSCALPDAT